MADGVTGAPIDPYKLDGYLLNTATTNALTAVDLQQTAYLNLKRSFAQVVPLTVKTGVDVARQMRDVRNPNPTLTFVGQDGLPNTADNNAVQVMDLSYSGRVAPYGFPGVQWTSNQNLWDLYQSNPAYFSENQANSYTQEVSLSKHAEEIIYAAYVRGDASFFKGRLKLVGGIRAEQTNVKAEG